MPFTTTLISPPAWVNSMTRRRTSAIQSMFSVPLSVEIFAPAERASQSTGHRIRRASSSAAAMRRHSGSASDPSSRLGSPRSSTRAIPSGWRAVKFRITPAMMLAWFWPNGRSTGTSRPSPSRSCSTNSPGGNCPPAASRPGASMRTSS